LALDGSIWFLLLANALSIAVALHQGWSVVSLMVVYWAQSVIIGAANVFRILALDRFSTENFTVNDRSVEPTPAVKRQTAGFFALHYGIFHVVYLLFLFAESGAVVFREVWFWACVAAFVVNHAWSYRYNRDVDRRGTPNIGTLMFTPYLRIVPMHLMIVFGVFTIKTALGLLVFGILKTFADVVMHVVEHKQLQKVSTEPKSN